MEKEIIPDDTYTIVGMFDKMQVGDLCKVPYETSRYNGIKTEAARRNRDARLTGELRGELDIKFRVSRVKHPGYTSVIRLK